jgi:2-methylisocitrate lyase-like PEP mutase family enzyme
VLANLKRIIKAVDLPVTLDFEGGYGQNPTQLDENIEQVFEAGAIGINFEDQIIGGDELMIHAKKLIKKPRVPILHG